MAEKLKAERQVSSSAHTTYCTSSECSPYNLFSPMHYNNNQSLGSYSAVSVCIRQGSRNESRSTSASTGTISFLFIDRLTFNRWRRYFNLPINFIGKAVTTTRYCTTCKIWPSGQMRRHRALANILSRYITRCLRHGLNAGNENKKKEGKNLE